MKAPPLAQLDPELIDVRLLRLFELLYSTGSVTRAAELLQQRQPTLSIWLAKLRRQLGDPLFVRTSQGMEPTPRAEALIAAVREALEALSRICAEPVPFEPATTSRQFRICMVDSSYVCLLPQVLAHLRAVAPSARLVASRIGADTAAALQSGEADLAIGLVPWLESGFYQQTLFPQDWVCLVNRVHPRIGERLTLGAYLKEAHVEIVGGTGAGLIQEGLARRKATRRVMLELPGFLGLSALISASDLVATLPRQIGETLAHSHAGLKVLACPLDLPTFTVKQHWHARFHDDPGNRWLRGVVAQLFMRKDPPRRAPRPMAS